MSVSKIKINDVIVTRLFYFFFKFFGLATMRFHTACHGNRKIQKFFFHKSKNGIIYNLFLIIIAIIASFYRIHVLYQFHRSGKINKFVRTIDTIQITTAFSTCSIILIQFCIQQNNAIKIFNKIISLKDTLKFLKHDKHVNTNSIYCSIAKVFVTNTITWFLSLIVTANDEHQVFLCQIGRFLCKLIIIYLIVEYTFFLKLIQQNLKNINDSFTCMVRTFHPKKPYIISENVILDDDNLKLDEFSQIHELHMSLCNVSNKLSNFYARPMLFCLLHIFISMLVYGYLLSNAIFFGKVSEAIGDCTSYFVQLLQNMCSVISLTTSVSAVIYEVNLTIIIIYNMKIKKKIFNSV